MSDMRKAAAALTWRGKTAVMSTPRVDRVGDVIELSAWDLEDFVKNPVMLYEHDRTMPIGVWRNVRTEDGALVGDPVFQPAEINPLAGRVAALVEGGWVKGFSVGFIPVELHPMGDGQRGYRITKAKLLECSVVAIPANTDALLKAAPGAKIVPVYAQTDAAASLWAARDAEAVARWVAPVEAKAVESTTDALAQLLANPAALAALAKALGLNEQPATQPAGDAPAGGDEDGKEDEDPVALALAAADEAVDAVVDLMADIEGEQSD